MHKILYNIPVNSILWITITQKSVMAGSQTYLFIYILDKVYLHKFKYQKLYFFLFKYYILVLFCVYYKLQINNN